MVDKWVRKHMKMAKALADDNQACYSRKIGVVLMSPEHEPISWGYNGSISKAPHNDDPRYLAHLWQNLLTDEQRNYLITKYSLQPAEKGESYRIGTFKVCAPVEEREADTVYVNNIGQAFVEKFTDCKTCPRRLLDIKSGAGLELCNCAHAERNAVANAAKRGAATKGSIAYCWCGVPCFDCASMLIQSGISGVYCLETGQPDYSPSSRGLFRMRGVKLTVVKPEDILEGENV